MRKKAKIFLTVFTPAVMPAFTYTGCKAEYKGKEGVLMKSEHAYYEQGFTLGYTQGSSGSHRNIDRLLHKRKIAALVQSGYFKIVSIWA